MREKYRLIPQEYYFCVPCALQIILDRYNIPYPSQKEIASILDFRKDANLHKIYPDIGTMVKEGETPGTYIKNLNEEFFDVLKINLREKFISYKHSDFRDPLLLTLLVISDFDILTGVSSKVFFSNPEQDTNHIILIEDFKYPNVQVVIPELNNSIRKVINFFHLIKSIETIKDGFWIISKK